MHFIRTQSDSTWGTGNYAITKADWKNISRKVFQAVNGDRGGHWTPRPWADASSQGIKIGGAGLQIEGPTEINHGGQLVIGSGAKVILGNNDWPLLGESHSGRRRTIVTSTTELMSSIRALWGFNRQYRCMQSLACSTQNGISPPIFRPQFVLPIRTHHGSRLTRATLRMRVPKDFKRLPFKMPEMRIIRVDEDGNVQPLKSTASGASSTGFISMPEETSTGTWYSGGNAKTFVYDCDLNNIIDNSLFTYYAEVIEEQSTESPIPLQQMDGSKERSVNFVRRVIYGTTPDAGVYPGLGTGNPVGMSTGELVLLMNSENAIQEIPIVVQSAAGPPFFPRPNGVYGVQATTFWKRWTSFDNVPGMLVVASEISSGTDDNAAAVKVVNTIWETDKDRYEVGDVIRYRSPIPRGNIYHSVTCDFDSIADMRSQ